MARTPSSNTQPQQAMDYVKINVGGKTFCTTRTTLTKDPNSLLSRMLHYGGYALEDEHGDYFIDRNPRCFEFVLDYLRDGEYFCSAEDLQALLREANYYQLPGLVKRVELEIDQQNESRIVNNSSSSTLAVAGNISSSRLLRGASSATLTTTSAATPPNSLQLQQQQQQQQQQQNNAQQQAANQQQQQMSSDVTLLAAQSLENLRRIDDSCRRIWSFCSRILVGQDGYLHVKRY